ncbi:hypothetical protein SPRG_02809 [Saprolegnia parasitica CBS 223.65]|uniref:Uncharacterized protein n=1 Tax=Saprolegnia parasitica (strain CBS 223.65) TaxID=695850 RepID=A0A067CSV9_SAPPC|nr:hypothetical protein SPRG_02809 [Saprolegnia parasitica CBS 223.65]KDO32330.1 hypothetical protein SPRG_02809 [Saprolegnia parasitica CBS 223.65]|eukprot:XP_012196786.1 hypothetical protein SPRG_02809 [Saprolegnia parasitica CBS 223.65]
MSVHLMRLNSILDDSSRSYFELEDSARSGVACEFGVVKDPTLMDKLTGHANHATLLVRIDDGSITTTGHDGEQQRMSTSDLWTKLHGKREVWLGTTSSDDAPTKHHTTLAFESRLAAVEFCGAVDLIQHIAYLRQPHRASAMRGDAVLRHHLEATLRFVEEMWTLAMWRELWPYSNMAEILQACLDDLGAIDATPAQVRSRLAEIYDTFYTQANMTLFVERDGVRFYRPSYIGLLVAKVKAAMSHIAMYAR